MARINFLLFLYEFNKHSFSFDNRVALNFPLIIYRGHDRIGFNEQRSKKR